MFKFHLKEVKKVATEGMTLEQVRGQMLVLLAEENLNQHRIGQLFNHVVDNQLAEKAGYKNARDYFAQQLCDVAPATLTTYGAVAANFSEEIARRFGVTCLYLLLIYKEVAEVEVNHDEPGPTLIEVPGENGAVTAKSFSECSVDQMRKALQRKRKPASSKPLPPEDLERVDHVRDSVTSRFAKGVPVRVQVRNHKGKTVVDFKGIPLDQLAKLAEALLAPPPAAGEVKADKAPSMS